MDQLRANKPDLLFDTVYYTSTTTDDVQKPYQTQHDVMTMLLPGAAPTYTSTSNLHPPAGLEHYRDDNTSQLPTPLSTNSPNNQSPSLPPTPGTQSNLRPSHPRAPTHSRSWSQQHYMPSPPAVHGVSSSVGTGLSTDPRRRSIPAVSELPVAKLAQMTMSSSHAGHFVPTVSQHRGLGLATSGVKRRIRDIGTQDAQVDFLDLHAPTPDAYTSYSWSSLPPTTSTAPYQASVAADGTVQSPSSLQNCESVVDPYSEGSFPLPSSSGLQDDLASHASFSLSHASPGAHSPTHSAGHTLPRQDTPLAAPEAPRKKRRVGSRKRVAEPKDPKATKRLQIQRKSDDKNIEYLYKLFVPASEGQSAKKERLGLIARYATREVGSQAGSVKHLGSVEQGMDHRSGESSTSRG